MKTRAKSQEKQENTPDMATRVIESSWTDKKTNYPASTTRLARQLQKQTNLAQPRTMRAQHKESLRARAWNKNFIHLYRKCGLLTSRHSPATT